MFFFFVGGGGGFSQSQVKCSASKLQTRVSQVMAAISSFEQNQVGPTARETSGTEESARFLIAAQGSLTPMTPARALSSQEPAAPPPAASRHRP